MPPVLFGGRVYKDKKIAVAGVNDNPEKFGYKIFTGLLAAGYDVYAVGVRGGLINSSVIYKSLSDLPQKPDIVITVVPPVGTEKITDDCVLLRVGEIWMQPGSYSQQAAEKARANGIKVTDRGCFMRSENLW